MKIPTAVKGHEEVVIVATVLGAAAAWFTLFRKQVAPVVNVAVPSAPATHPTPSTALHTATALTAAAMITRGSKLAAIVPGTALVVRQELDANGALAWLITSGVHAGAVIAYHDPAWSVSP
jgi:hypothetical protein